MNTFNLEEIGKAAEERLRSAMDMNSINEIRTHFLGKKGELAEAKKALKDLSAEERPAFGQLVNEVSQKIEKEIKERAAELERALQDARLSAEAIDVTLPGKKIRYGHAHPNTLALEEVEKIFIGMGYEVVEGPEVEYDSYNFEKLNIPKGHPARDEQDTFYINSNILLRTQTSSVQARYMETHKPPLRMICPGRVFRSDAVDATPSAEVDVSCFKCRGKGCRFCKGEGWIEILGCGMVHPKVLESCGIDSNEYSGFAFGVGLERIALLKYEIDDMRLLYENDLRFLEQF